MALYSTSTFLQYASPKNVKIWIGVPWGDQLALMTIFSFLNQFEFLFTRDFKYVV